MSDRRFTDKPAVNPQAVRSLAPNHPAMVENRTLFPSTVVEVTDTEPKRLLVSGVNNRKLGKTVEKGKFKGYAIYQLSLEERATCPSTCFARAYCFGNGMQLARRHRIGDPDVFYDRLGHEIAELCLSEYSETGVLVRLHVLGDFPSVEYVAFWKDALDEYENLACYGYTNCRLGDDESGEIAAAIESVKAAYPKRFRIRWSGFKGSDGAVVANAIPEGPRIDDALVCPVFLDKTACCATCALCWEAPFETIAFVKHGPKSGEMEAQTVMEDTSSWKSQEDDTTKPATNIPENITPRHVRPIKGGLKPNKVSADLPRFKAVDPATLLIEPSYQRDLSGKSLSLIRRIVAGWDWAKFKPPICAETKNGLFVIDGQHTAIAAASHPGIQKIPVMVVEREKVEMRAEAFVSQNTARVAMTPLQVFHAEVASKDADAVAILKTTLLAGASIPRSVPVKGKAQPGQVIAVSAVKRSFRILRQPGLERLLRIAVQSGLYPINALVIRALTIILRESYFADTARLADDEIAQAIRNVGFNLKAFEAAVEDYAFNVDERNYRAAAELIHERANKGQSKDAA